MDELQGTLEEEHKNPADLDTGGLSAAAAGDRTGLPELMAIDS